MFEGEYLYQKKWNGKLYDTNGNIIEGEYLNGKRYGEGKKYYFGKIYYDGEFLNGKRYGKGKEYRYSNFKAQEEDYYPEEKREKRYEYL